MLEDHDERWPTDGDRLFRELHPAHGAAAFVTDHVGERRYRLPMGYKRAGDLLLARAAEDIADRPNVIYAALFCYRHSVELFLKELIQFGDGQRKSDHFLDALWKSFVQVARDRGCENSIGMAAAESIVRELHEVDKGSDGFRYPTDIAGAPFKFSDRFIDLENLRTVMDGLVNFFECTDLMFANQDSI